MDLFDLMYHLTVIATTITGSVIDTSCVNT